MMAFEQHDDRNPPKAHQIGRYMNNMKSQYEFDHDSARKRTLNVTDACNYASVKSRMRIGELAQCYIQYYMCIRDGGLLNLNLFMLMRKSLTDKSVSGC